MKKRLVILVASLLFIILLTLGLKFSSVDKDGRSFEDISHCYNNSNDIDREICITRVAVENRSLDICKFIKSRDRLNSCYGQVLEDESYCKKIKDSFYRTSCYYGLYESFKYKNCSPSTSLSVCNSINEKRLESYCEVLINDSDENNIGGYECYIKLAFMFGREDVCEKIKKDYLKKSCYLALSLHNEDESFCNKISDLNERDYCYINLGINKNSSIFCSKVENEANKKFCFYEIAAKNNNLNICNELSSEDKELCYDFFADKNDDASACSLISNETLRNGCFSSVAVDKEDIKICYNISGNRGIDNCLTHIAEKTRNVSICEDYVSENYKDYCFEWSS